MTLQVVDPHMHLWDLAKLRYPGLEAQGENFLGDYSSMAKTYLLSDFLGEAGDVTVQKAVHIEAIIDQADRVAETEWLQGIADQKGFPHGIVCCVDLAAPDARAILDAQMAFRNLRGVRQVLNRHSNPLYAYTAEDHIADPVWRKNFSQLGHLNLSFDLQIYPHQMKQAAELAAQYPDTTIILNHAGMYADRQTPAGWTQWKNGMSLMAKQSNVAVKISGLGMFDHRWTDESIRPLVFETLNLFGADRVMFASNFPVDRLFSTFSDVWRTFERLCSGLTAAENEMLFRSNAVKFYRL